MSPLEEAARMQKDIGEIEREIIATAKRVCERFDQEFERVFKEYPEKASLYYKNLAPHLIGRFKGNEREPKVAHRRASHGFCDRLGVDGVVLL